MVLLVCYMYLFLFIYFATCNIEQKLIIKLIIITVQIKIQYETRHNFADLQETKVRVNELLWHRYYWMRLSMIS